MPITTVPAKTSISRRTIQSSRLQAVAGWLQSACITAAQSRPVRIAAACAGICPGYAGQQHPRRYVRQWPAIWSVAAYGSSVPAYGSAAPAYGQPTQLRNLHSPSTASDVRTYGLRTIGADPLLSGADSAPIHAVRIQSATNLRAADLLSGDQQQPGYGYAQKSKIIAGLLGLFLGTLGVHNFYLGYTGKAVAQLLLTLIGWIILIGPIISGIWALIEAVLILCSSYGSNWHRDGHGQELQD